jgi:hypothetical protein
MLYNITGNKKTQNNEIYRPLTRADVLRQPTKPDSQPPKDKIQPIASQQNNVADAVHIMKYDTPAINVG